MKTSTPLFACFIGLATASPLASTAIVNRDAACNPEHLKLHQELNGLFNEKLEYVEPIDCSYAIAGSLGDESDECKAKRRVDELDRDIAKKTEALSSENGDLATATSGPCNTEHLKLLQQINEMMREKISLFQPLYCVDLGAGYKLTEQCKTSLKGKEIDREIAKKTEALNVKSEDSNFVLEE
ncbi:hypothetical protein CDD83_4274 [Cordyceps sp. RAO-2017]|nr:hypothetical protein CDD83_4274 [Cordyceps sp. RAO-2017]